MSVLTIFIQHMFLGKKKNKRHPDWKERSKNISEDDMMLYVENPQGHKKLLELINRYRKVARYKINIKKSIVFLHVCNE